VRVLLGEEERIIGMREPLAKHRLILLEVGSAGIEGIRFLRSHLGEGDMICVCRGGGEMGGNKGERRPRVGGYGLNAGGEFIENLKRGSCRFNKT